MKKKLLIVLVLFAVLGAVGFGVYKYMGQRRVSTSLLATPFASAPADVKALIDQAAAGIKSADYLGSVKALKAVADKVAKWKDYYAARGLPPEFPLLNSVDFSQPTDFGGLIKAWNGSAQTAFPAPLTMRYS